MRANNVVSFIGAFVNKFEPQYTLRLDDIIFSRSHGHEICVMQLVGKNTFPKYTTEELLADPKAMIGLSPQDAVKITQLHYKILERKKNYQVLEIDRNGTILLRDYAGNIARYSERFISSSCDMLSSMNSKDSHDLGYRVGYRDGLNVKKSMNQSSNIKSHLYRLNPFKSKEQKAK